MASALGTDDKKAVAGAIGQLWFEFAEHSGGGASPVPAAKWPAYRLESDENVVFRSPLPRSGAFAKEAGRRKAYCDFWETIAL